MATTSNISLYSALSNANRGIIVTITYASDAKMNKTNNPFYGRVTKVSKGQYQFAPTFENCANNALGRGGFSMDYKADAPKGFTRIDSRFVESNKSGEIHAGFRPLANSKTEVYYLVDGRKATEEEVASIKAFMPTKSDYSQKQASFGLTNANDQVKWRWLNLNKILEIKGI